MKNYFKLLFVIAILASLTSCKKEPSLQRYFIDSEENSDFISFDISSNILQLNAKGIVSDEAQKTLNSIHKVRLLGLELKDDNAVEFSAEKTKIKAILKNPKYKQLGRFGNGKNALQIYYLGSEDAIDEVIVFGINKEKGLGLVRILGEDMKPERIVKLVQNVDFDKTNSIHTIKDIFKNF